MFFIATVTPVGMVPALAMPVLIVVFLWLREDITSTYREKEVLNRHIMLSEVALLCRLYRVIADYFQRPRAMDEFAWVVDDYNKSFVNTMAIRTNNEYCAIWLANILAAYWMYVGAQQVVQEEDPLPLGGYIVVLGVFRQMGLAYKSMYSNYLKVHQT